MNEDKEYIRRLFGKYIQNEISEEELEVLFESIKRGDLDDFTNEVDWLKYFGEDVEMLPGNLKISDKKPTKKLYPHLKKVASAAAVILCFIVAGVYIYLSDKEEENVHYEAIHSVEPLDVLPGQNYAVLTSSKGERIVLSNTGDGQLNTGDNAEILKVKDGELVYTMKKRIEVSELVYNTLSTPRGGQYQLTLSDGSRVWLNAASSIRFPVEFLDGERRVEITGEVYFDVIHNDQQPFIVHAGSSVIEDLGTAFNVTAYEDEAKVKTTLVEGVVKVGEYILSPGEQAVQDENNNIQILKNIDLDNVVSWKNGFFSFENVSLAEIMKVLSRWYDLEVDYKDTVNLEKRFSGKIDRSLTLLQVLEGLKLTAQNFDIQPGNKIVIRG